MSFPETYQGRVTIIAFPSPLFLGFFLFLSRFFLPLFLSFPFFALHFPFHFFFPSSFFIPFFSPPLFSFLFPCHFFSCFPPLISSIPLLYPLFSFSSPFSLFPFFLPPSHFKIFASCIPPPSLFSFHTQLSHSPPFFSHFSLPLALSCRSIKPQGLLLSSTCPPAPAVPGVTLGISHR